MCSGSRRSAPPAAAIPVTRPPEIRSVRRGDDDAGFRLDDDRPRRCAVLRHHTDISGHGRPGGQHSCSHTSTRSVVRSIVSSRPVRPSEEEDAASMKLVVVRHAFPVCQESTDGPANPGLSDTGRSQARANAGWRGTERVDRVYTSPLARRSKLPYPSRRRTRPRRLSSTGSPSSTTKPVPTFRSRNSRPPRGRSGSSSRLARCSRAQGHQSTRFSSA